MTEVGVGTGTALRLKLWMPPRISPRDLATKTVDVANAIDLLDVRYAPRRKASVEEPGRGKPTQSVWHSANYQVVDIHLGSLTMIIVSSGVALSGAAVAAAKGLPGLMTFLEGLRDWQANRQKAIAEAALLELEVAAKARELLERSPERDVGAEQAAEVDVLMQWVNGRLGKDVRAQLPEKASPQRLDAIRNSVLSLTTSVDEVELVERPQ